LNQALLEDELFNLIRINPKNLPQGKIKIIPSTLFSRLSHIDFKVENATATLQEKNNNKIYTIKYDSIDRAIVISFEKSFPHQIQSWEETHRGLTTKATKKKTILLDYWSKNGVADLKYRQELGLE